MEVNVMRWKDALRGDPLPWLLEPDPVQPGVRYFALRDLLDRSEDDPEVRQAQAAVMSSGPVPVILAAQEPEGYWEKPEHVYYSKYRGTAWQVIFLAQLGASGDDPKVRKACKYVLDYAIASHGGFSPFRTPSGFAHCLAGNLGAALIDLGWLDNERLQRALEWQARMITGEGIASAESKDTSERYDKSGTTDPLFACSGNAGLPCAWGGVKAMLALGKVPSEQRTRTMKAAIDTGVGFLLSRDPAIADYPAGYSGKPSSSWFKFGYPIGYVTDVLQNLEALAGLGYAKDPRLAHTLELVKSKQDEHGRWKLEYTYNGKMWVDIEQKGQPSKWITLRALRILKAAYPE